MQNNADLQNLDRKEQADRLMQLGLESGNRYGGNPDLLLKEHPELDFRNPAPRKKRLDELNKQQDA